MSANETAEAILLVIKRLFKWAVVTAIGLVAIGLLWWGCYELYSFITDGYPKSKVKVTLIRKDELCTNEFPFFVGVVNNSKKTIISYSFNFDVRKKGHSTNIADWVGQNSDTVIKPGEGIGGCWRIKHKDSTYNQDQWIPEGEIDVDVRDFRPRFE
jgi:hypothetical protein